MLIVLFGAVVVGSTVGPQAGLAAWNRQDPLLKALCSVAFAAVVVLLATWLSGLTAPLLRWYEGDWNRRSWRWLAGAGRGWHTGVFSRLRPKDLGHYQCLYTSYPQDAEEVMPTRLGNILKNAALYPEELYGIDAALVWPRLNTPDPGRPPRHARRRPCRPGVLPHRLQPGRLLLTASGLFLLAAGAPAGLFLLYHAGGAAVALLSYVCALGPARLYGEHVKVTFDVYRGDLLKHLGHEDEEWVMWEALAKQRYRGVPVAMTVRAAELPAATARPRREAPRRRVRLPLSAWFLLLTALISAAGALLLA
ncbi:hypothetical protein SAMN05444920_112346 [Nonomuraea solani]|uniref:Uncharacterized protein n=1 Tax=Nonomuraea solani TaxID=1144553 RepID=A0A1H6EN82_9ACTN|nr:hypothetical protein [Nonomuraea solani]SEG99297.1 hypothetical protein SAMN05444920_112346 [Nonomuraea solani]